METLEEQLNKNPFEELKKQIVELQEKSNQIYADVCRNAMYKEVKDISGLKINLRRVYDKLDYAYMMVTQANAIMKYYNLSFQ